jgi:hypothetical protein
MKIINRVQNILENLPETKDSDKKLLLAYWEQQGLCLNQTQRERFMTCTSAETITRARRALKPVTGIGLTSVDVERFNKYVEYKQNGAVSWLND